MAIGRYAPSPTGTLHLGNLRTAVAAWLFARSLGSEFLLRWEDLDGAANRDHEIAQRHDLTALGLDFDGAALRQSERLSDHHDAINDLTAAGLTYECWCSRREIREAAAAPHGSHVVYPGTCRDLATAARTAKAASGRAPALRLRSGNPDVRIVDRLNGPVTAPVDDFVIARGDGTPAYHLAVVVDDDAQRVEEVVRADDLLDSTPRHAHLQSVLAIAEPTWTHVPLVLDHHRDRLAKRDGSVGLDWWVGRGGTVATLLGAFGRTLGMEVEPEATITDLLTAFDPAAIPTVAAMVEETGSALSLAG